MSTNSRLCLYRRHDATGTMIHAVRFCFIPSEHYSLGPRGHGVRNAQALRPPLNSPEFSRWAYFTGGKPTRSRRSIGQPPMTAEAEVPPVAAGMRQKFGHCGQRPSAAPTAAMNPRLVSGRSQKLVRTITLTFRLKPDRALSHLTRFH